MEALKFGNGVWATKTGSSMAYNDQSGNYKPLPFNVVRNSIATRVNKEGLIEVVGKDKLRIDYTDTDKGVALLENSATNSLVQSNQFDTTWSANNATLTSGQIGVGGSTDAWKLESNSNTSETYIRQTASLSGTSSLTIYAKKGNSNFLGVYIGSSGADISTYFDLNNGVVGNTSNTIETKIKSVGNDWYRCTVVGSNINQNVNFYVTDANSNFLSNNGSYIYIQYSQLESGSIASSYIPTSGSAVTRAADVASGSGNSKVFSDTQGVLYANIANSETSNGSYIGISNGTTNQRLILGNEFGLLQVYSNGINIDGNVKSANKDFNKIAIKYTSSNASIYFNGFLLKSKNASYNLSGINQLIFSAGSTTFARFHGKTKELGYYDAILTDSELEKLTSYNSLSELVTELNLNTL